MTTTARIEIPRNFEGDRVVSRFLGQVVRHGSPAANLVEFDFSRVNWIAGDAIASLSNLLEWLTAKGSNYRFTGLRTPLPAGVRYLDDCGFFEIYGGGPLSNVAQLRDTTLPLARLQHEYTYDWLQHRLRPWLSSKIGASTEAMDIIQTCLYEVFNNINDHSEVEVGCCFAQWFPKEQHLDLTVADFGIGIPGSMKRLYEGIVDDEAIKLALEEGVSSKSSARNLGLGLQTLVGLVTGYNGGDIAIYSGNGRLFRGHRNEEFYTKSYFPGTLVQARFRTDRFPEEELSEAIEELEW